MIDITPLNNYYQECDDFQKAIIDIDIKRQGREKTWDIYYDYIDCTRISANGVRIMQTIGIPYINEMSEILHLVYNYFKDDLDNRLQLILNRHNANIEFEEINPPVIYKDKKKASTIKNINKKKADNKDKTKTPSAAEKKLANKVLKLNALSFKMIK